jgi:hypothetical protein
MKACFPLLLCILPALITTTVLAEEAISSQPELEALWHTKDLRVPESVL